VVQVFSDEAAAHRLKDRLNTDPYAHADVDEYVLQGADYELGHTMIRVSKVSRLSGDVTAEEDRVYTDECGGDEGRVTTRITGGSMPLEPFEVRTCGDAKKVPQAHSDAVAKKRAEVLGL
jgi:hypothetical protein